MTIENPALTQVYSRVNGGGTTFTTGAAAFEDDDVFVYIYNIVVHGLEKSSLMACINPVFLFG